MSHPRIRALTRLLCARLLCTLLALLLGLPAFAAPDAPSLPLASKASCCCGAASACCAPRSPCCVKEDDRSAPEPTTQRAAPTPEPRIIEGPSRLAALAHVLPADAPHEGCVVASPAEGRLHLRHAVFRT